MKEGGREGELEGREKEGVREDMTEEKERKEGEEGEKRV